MSEQEKPFVINDRRKFRADGELREPTATPADQPTQERVTPRPPEAFDSSARVLSFSDAPHRESAEHTTRDDHRSAAPIPINSAHTVTPVPEPGENAPQLADEADPEAPEGTLPPPPTAEEIAQVKSAYEATADRLETVMRATNPGAEHLPPMDFSRLVQSVYMSAMMQLGAGTPQGEQARVDLLGAKQSIDMLGVIEDKTANNLSENEQRLLESAVFELRMGFLEITQLLARQAQAQGQNPGQPRGGAPGANPFGAGPGGPRIVT